MKHHAYEWNQYPTFYIFRNKINNSRDNSTQEKRRDAAKFPFFRLRRVLGKRAAMAARRPLVVLLAALAVSGAVVMPSRTGARRYPASTSNSWPRTPPPRPSQNDMLKSIGLRHWPHVGGAGRKMTVNTVNINYQAPSSSMRSFHHPAIFNRKWSSKGSCAAAFLRLILLIVD